MFYGSRVLGSGRTASDLDALLLHEDDSWPTHRRSALWGEMPITIYVLTPKDLAQDGRERRFGGYFALKLFAPHLTDTLTRMPVLSAAAADFLAPFSREVADRWPCSGWSADQLVAHAHLAFIDLYPDAASYLARLRRDRGLFSRVWIHQRNVHIEALQSGGHIRSAGNGQWHYAEGSAFPDLARERARCAARFWAFGAVCHEGNAGFPDLYFRKADDRAPRTEQQRVLHFMEQVADGGEVP